MHNCKWNKLLCISLYVRRSSYQIPYHVFATCVHAVAQFDFYINLLPAALQERIARTRKSKYSSCLEAFVVTQYCKPCLVSKMWFTLGKYFSACFNYWLEKIGLVICNYFKLPFIVLHSIQISSFSNYVYPVVYQVFHVTCRESVLRSFIEYF